MYDTSNLSWLILWHHEQISSETIAACMLGCARERYKSSVADQLEVSVFSFAWNQMPAKQELHISHGCFYVINGGHGASEHSGTTRAGRMLGCIHLISWNCQGFFFFICSNVH